MGQPLILVTNDDGIGAPGLALLAEALSIVGTVRVFAPDRQQSAVGHGVSLHRPLRVDQVKDGWHAVDGTPTDCVMLAVRALLGHRPDLVVSGVNPGANMGDDVTYSGTVAGAYEGMLLGLPALAVSDTSYAPMHMATAAKVAAGVASWMLRENFQEGVMLNLNVPDVPLHELAAVAWTRMGQRDYQDEIVVREDPRGRRYYWIGGAEPTHVPEPGTDFAAVEAGMASITPLHRDLTHHESLRRYADTKIPL